MPKVRFFESSAGGRDVIQKFIKIELKRLPTVAVQLLDQIRILELVETRVLRERGTIEHVEGEILSFKFKANIAGNIWVRMLLACWPNDNSVFVLLPLLKKRNKLDPDDINRAKKNLKILIERQKQNHEAQHAGRCAEK